MKAISDLFAAPTMFVVMIGCPVWGGEEGAPTKPRQTFTAAQSDTTRALGNPAFTSVVQQDLPTGPDYREAICFETGAAPWWPQAPWIRTPRTEQIEAQVKHWLGGDVASRRMT